MDLANSTTPSSSSSIYDVIHGEDNQLDSVSAGLETNCWGCGLRVLVASYAPVFRCGWCGAITKPNDVKRDNKHIWWRRLRDRCFVGTVLLFMLFFICGGVWAVYPILFSISNFCGVFHSFVTVILSISTLSLYCLAACRHAGASSMIIWGSYPTVGKGALQNYTFCHYCSKPKSSRTHHCRSCGTCILDMDHHCPFIGNCVGAANHRSFILFLISTVVSTLYTAIMTSYSAHYIWPSVDHHKPIHAMNGSVNTELIVGLLKDTFLAFVRAATFLPVRGLVLVYLFIASVSVSIGLSALLFQQLGYIYAGKTYLSHLTSMDSEEMVEKDCQNFVTFFGCSRSAASYLPSYWKSKKWHKT